MAHWQTPAAACCWQLVWTFCPDISPAWAGNEHHVWEEMWELAKRQQRKNRSAKVARLIWIDTISWAVCLCVCVCIKHICTMCRCDRQPARKSVGAERVCTVFLYLWLRGCVVSKRYPFLTDMLLSYTGSLILNMLRKIQPNILKLLAEG